ncbi:hypothetical protein Tco_0077121 [Tanacetum coccineum]
MNQRSRRREDQVLKIWPLFLLQIPIVEKGKVHTAQSFSTSSGQVTTASTEVAIATFSHDTICAYIATQQSGSQIKYEDITQIDNDDIEEMDINGYGLC